MSQSFTKIIHQNAVNFTKLYIRSRSFSFLITTSSLFSSTSPPSSLSSPFSYFSLFYLPTGIDKYYVSKAFSSLASHGGLGSIVQPRMTCRSLDQHSFSS
ncbi:hypothetical protein KSP39_PZI021627 [Platanthera zijinensis]|uniref:Uncharacterized protein n=1 Tax=Platanthera zijinensis TaxID=2320716 RepID=A0AAP0AYF1_9ASPA